MKESHLSTDVSAARASVLDHSSEFVELVYRAAPAEYQRLKASERFRQELEQANRFNHGKLYAYAEFVVFRREFTDRFPESPPKACINAFCRLFLKNDISISNLLALMEGSGELDQLLSDSRSTSWRD